MGFSTVCHDKMKLSMAYPFRMAYCVRLLGDQPMPGPFSLHPNMTKGPGDEVELSTDPTVECFGI